MSQLFDTAPELPEGCWHLKEFLDDSTQRTCVRFSRDLLATHPLMQPRTASGYDLSLRVSSWGLVGWFGSGGQYRYIDKHENGQPWPVVPNMISRIMHDALKHVTDEMAATLYSFDNFRLDTVLLNYYPAPGGKLGRHQDVTEEDKECPIVTVSLGDSCIFNIGTTNYDDKGIDLQLDSGDVFVMGLSSRLAYHGVKKILPGTSDLLKNGGRISLTGRRVFK